MFKNIVVAFVTPAIKQKSFFVGMSLAKKYGGSLTVVDFIYRRPPMFHFFETKTDRHAAEKFAKKARGVMKKFEGFAQDAGIPIRTKVVLTDSVAHKVVDYVGSHRVDLLIIDHPHLSESEEAFYEDIVNAIHHEVRLPVLTLR